MAAPSLTFFCKLDADGLESLLHEPVIDQLVALKAGVSLGILDFSSPRIEAVRRMNQAGIPVIAWLMLPEEQGFWFTLANVDLAVSRYSDFRQWARENQLHFSAVGLNIEPHIQETYTLVSHPWRLIPKLLRNTFQRKHFREARAAYQKLVNRIRQDGFSVESYQFPILEDDRRAHSTFLQRLSGIVDLHVDREIWMLYTSFFRQPVGLENLPLGLGILWSYAPDAQGIALGSTGGGVEQNVGGLPLHPLTWDELSRDLRLAWYWSNNLYIFSLEGCWQHGYLSRLGDFDWDHPVIFPEAAGKWVDGWRQAMSSLLWVSARTTPILIGFGTVFLIILRVRRRLRARRHGSKPDVQ